jgi:hypothetical protein
MKYLKTTKLIWTFYKSFLLLSLIITAFCIKVFWMFEFRSFFGIFWCKVITLGITYYFINANKSKEYYYYQNLGITKAMLWTTTIAFDFILFLSSIILTYRIK